MLRSIWFLYFFAVWSGCNGFVTEDRQLFSQLQEHITELREVLTSRIIALEETGQQQEELRKELSTRVDDLEETVRKQDAQIKSQEILIANLQVKQQKATETALYLTSTDIGNGRAAIYRTCRETRAADPSLSSGMYWVDPDGQGVGDDPIYVYCNMTSGTTEILHDLESITDVGHCADPGCYSRVINYSATMRQMIALSELSNECRQAIKYDCVSAPFEFNDIVYAWWNDRNSNPKYFWSGSNASVHTCQCGINGNCIESPTAMCNCDSGLPTALFDDGVITNKNLLPVTRLNFGRTILDTSSGQHTLGRFVCSGQVSITGMPTSCQDLWHIGHTMSGLYSVRGAKMIESVYCDFTKLPTDEGFQTWIGFNDVKSSLVYFYATKNTHFNTTNTPIPYDLERLNVGGALNLTSGIFTAPKAGRYFFSFNAFPKFPSGRAWMNIALSINNVFYGRTHTDQSSSLHDYLSLQMTFSLEVGDQVSMQISGMYGQIFLFDDGAHYTHFTGWLIEEDISISL